MELHPNSRMNRNLAGSRAARRSPIISGRTFRWNRRATITGDEAWFRVDLVFFHRRLICLVIIDLKVGRFSYADAGQMHLYLNYAREHWMKPGENPPVGLILLRRKRCGRSTLRAGQPAEQDSRGGIPDSVAR